MNEVLYLNVRRIALRGTMPALLSRLLGSSVISPNNDLPIDSSE